MVECNAIMMPLRFKMENSMDDMAYSEMRLLYGRTECPYPREWGWLVESSVSYQGYRERCLNTKGTVIGYWEARYDGSGRAFDDYPSPYTYLEVCSDCGCYYSNDRGAGFSIQHRTRLFDHRITLRLRAHGMEADDEAKLTRVCDDCWKAWSKILNNIKEIRSLVDAIKKECDKFADAGQAQRDRYHSRRSARTAQRLREAQEEANPDRRSTGTCAGG